MPLLRSVLKGESVRFSRAQEVLCGSCESLHQWPGPLRPPPLRIVKLHTRPPVSRHRISVRCILDMVPNIRSITLVIRHSMFDYIMVGSADKSEATKNEFERFVRKFQLDDVKGLHEIRFLVARSEWLPGEHNKLWKTNVESLARYLIALVTRPKMKIDLRLDAGKVRNAGDVPLYLGSKVSMSPNPNVFASHASHPSVMEEELPTFTDQEACLKHSPPTALQKASLKLSIKDIPSDLEEFKLLMQTDGEEVMELIKGLKRKAVEGTEND